MQPVHSCISIMLLMLAGTYPGTFLERDKEFFFGGGREVKSIFGGSCLRYVQLCTAFADVLYM